jgi:RNA polymerase sigma-70 factor (ECF subfamily)
MTAFAPDTDELLRRAQAGEPDARGPLWQRHRGRRRCIGELVMDLRSAARLDPSDVVQEALAEADSLPAVEGGRPIARHPR